MSGWGKGIVTGVVGLSGGNSSMTSVNPNHVYLFVKYPPKYPMICIAKIIKGRSRRLLRKELPHLKD